MYPMILCGAVKIVNGQNRRAKPPRITELLRFFLYILNVLILAYPLFRLKLFSQTNPFPRHAVYRIRSILFQFFFINGNSVQLFSPITWPNDLRNCRK